MNTNIELLSKLGNSKKPGLIKLKSALSLFDNPHEKLSNCILISGTNGKGTVARTLSDILKTSRYKVGLYTSPHLIRINERIRINNKEISSKQLNNLIGEVTSKINVRLSYFELLTLVSIVHFHRNKNDINIFEVGLGGKFDATNVVKSKVSIITNIGIDHQEYLGNTITSIAREKAGIIRANGFVSTNAKGKGLKVIKEYAKKKKASIYIGETNDYTSFRYKTNLIGTHQVENLFLSVNTIKILTKHFNFRVSEKNIESALKKVKIPGRYQVFSKKPLKIIDTAHNLAAIKNLVKNIKIIFGYKRVTFLFGMLKDKKPLECIRLIEEVSKKIYLINVPNKRSFDAEKISIRLKNKKIKFTNYDNLSKIINANENIVIAGSNFLVGNLLDKYIKRN